MIGRLSRPDPPRTIPSIAIRETVNSPRRLLYESLLSPSSTILLHCTVYTPIAYRSCAIIPDTIGGGSHAMHFSVRTTLFPFYIHTFNIKINLHPLISFVSSIRDIYKKKKNSTSTIVIFSYTKSHDNLISLIQTLPSSSYLNYKFCSSKTNPSIYFSPQFPNKLIYPSYKPSYKYYILRS